MLTSPFLPSHDIIYLSHWGISSMPSLQLPHLLPAFMEDG
jgi:hypothetical protein